MILASAGVKAEDQKISPLPAIDKTYRMVQSNLYNTFKGVDFKQIQNLYQQNLSKHLMGQFAHVVPWPRKTLSGEIDPNTREGEFIRMRLVRIQKALDALTGYRHERSEVPRIGASFSGGGYRAMLLTSGFLKGFEQAGILDLILYISTLSGSTWCLGPWTFMQQPDKKVDADLFRMLLIDMVHDGKFNLLSPKNARGFPAARFLNNVLWPKFIFKQPIGSVDLYGGALAHTLLNDFKDKKFQMHLANQWEHIKKGNHPWPMYTAVSINDEGGTYRYNWYEFNPEFIINKSTRQAIPSFAFGRKFERGKAIDNAPQQSFGYLMGIFGSAYTVNVQDILRIYFGTSQEELGKPIKLEKVLQDWFNQSPAWAKGAVKDFKSITSSIKKGKPKEAWKFIKNKLQKKTSASVNQLRGPMLAAVLKSIPNIKIAGKKVKLATARVAPAQVANPFLGYDQASAWLAKREYLTFVDAGIDYNIPLLPLFDPERRLDIVFVGDASGDVLDGPVQLTLAFADIKRIHGVSYKKDDQLSDAMMHVYRPEQDAYPYVEDSLKEVQPPVVLYFNFINDVSLLESKAKNNAELKKSMAQNRVKDFSPDCLKKWCGTFNFDYSSKEVVQLTGIAEANVLAHKKTILDIIAEVVESKREDLPAFGL